MDGVSRDTAGDRDGSAAASCEDSNIRTREMCLEGGELMHEEIASAGDEYESPEVETKLMISRQCD